MRFALLGVAESWYTNDLRRAGGDKHQIDCFSFSSISAIIDSGRSEVRVNGQDLSQFHAILVRTMPPGSLEQVVFRMDALFQLELNGTRVLNPPKSLEAAIDKHLALVKLKIAGLPIPKTIVCQTWEDAMAAFQELSGNVVVKPIFGGEGRGITRITDEAIAFRTFRSLQQLGSVIYLQEFIPHEGFDIRLLVLGDRVMGMKRTNATDWRTNVSLGAVTEPIEVNDQLRSIAIDAANAIEAPFVGVDLLTGRDGRQFVIEVNAVPGWRRLAKTLEIDVANLVLEFLLKSTL